MNRNLSVRCLRRVFVLSLSTVAISSGCASISSPTNWFAREKANTAENSGLVGSVVGAGKGFTGQLKSMGTTVGSAVVKAKDAVIAPFSTTPATNDPTSLANMPTNLGPEIWVTNGQLFEAQGKYAQALDNYSKALEVEPKNEAALLSTARLYERQQQNDKAEAYLSQVLAIKPQAEIYNELASIQQKQGKTAEAQASVQNAIALEPANARFRNNLAGIMVASGRSDEAVQQLQQVFPAAVANYNVAYLHFSNRNIAGAQQHLQLALQADPNLKEARDLMDKITGSPTTQSAMAAYQTANQIYRTAQAVTAPTVQASPAIHQQAPTAGSLPGASSLPTSGYPAAK